MPKDERAELVERLRSLIEHGDHKRLCEGREYVCNCGHDGQVAAALTDALAALEPQAETVTRLREALAEARDVIAEADQRIAWESLGLGNSFAENVESLLAKIDAALSCGADRA